MFKNVPLGFSIAKPLAILCGRRWKNLCQLKSGIREGDNNTQLESRRGVVRLGGGGGAREGRKESSQKARAISGMSWDFIARRISIVTDFACSFTILLLYILRSKAVHYFPFRARRHEQTNDRKTRKSWECWLVYKTPEMYAVCVFCFGFAVCLYNLGIIQSAWKTTISQH